MDIFGRGFAPNQDHRLALGVHGHGLIGAKHRRTARAPGACRQAAGEHLARRAVIDHGMQKGLHVLGRHAQQRLFLVDHALAHHVHRDAHRGAAAALAAARLQDVTAAFLNRELDVLHVAVVLFEQRLRAVQFIVGVREPLAQGLEGLRGAQAGDHVFARGVEQHFAEEFPVSRGRVARERDAGSGVLAEVTEHHGLHVDRGAQRLGDVVHLAVDVGARRVPGLKHRGHGLLELHEGVFGEVHQALERGDQLLPVPGLHGHIAGVAVCLFVFLDQRLHGVHIGA